MTVVAENKISCAQKEVLSALMEDYKLTQYGTKTGYLVENHDGVNNPHPTITAVKIPTVKKLLKLNLIKLEKRMNWRKVYSVSPKGEQLWLALNNTPQS